MSFTYEQIRAAVKRTRQQTEHAVVERMCVVPRFGGCGTQVNEADQRYGEKGDGSVVDRWAVYLASGLCASCQIAVEDELAAAEEGAKL